MSLNAGQNHRIPLMTLMESSIAEMLAADGCAVIPEFVTADAVAELACECKRRDGAGDFRAAAIGRGADRREQPQVRGDRLLWLDDATATPPEHRLLQALDRLRLALN